MSTACPDCVPDDQMIEINDWSDVPESAWTDEGASFWCTHKLGPGILDKMERVQ